jgi:hypothetical protein
MNIKISEAELLEKIKNGKSIAMNCFTLTDNFVKNLESVIRNLLSYYNKLDFLPGIFGTAQELVNWTCLSNKRYFYYKQNDLSIDDEKAYIDNESRFLSTINKLNSESYRNFLVENEMYVHTVFEHSEEGLSIKVHNYTENVVNQEKYLRDYLKQAMNYANVLDYFNDHPEDPQGKNLGLAFSIIILKESGLRPDLMRISKPGKGAYSRIEIPFMNSYHSIRDKILNDESIVPFEKKDLVPEKFKEELELRIKKMSLESVEIL